MSVAARKSQLRAQVAARRRLVTSPERIAWDRAIAGATVALLGELAAGRGWSPTAGVPAPLTVCAYAPQPGEPGGTALLDALHGAVEQVLLPVTPPATATATGPQPLAWARFTGHAAMAPGRFGIAEPTGPRLAPATIADANAVLVPAVACDLRGHRLGRGGGFYDRTLALSRPATARLCLLYSSDIVTDIPVEAHDLPVHAVISERGAQWITRPPGPMP